MKYSSARWAPVSAAEIAAVLGGRRTGGQYICRCPAHDDRRPSLAVRDADDGRVLVHCHGPCEQDDVIDALKALGLWEGMERRSAPLEPKPPTKPAADNCGKARWLWWHSRPIERTVAEIYLRRERGIACKLPPTLAFLPPRNADQHPAMIAAFGLCDEVEPSVLSAPREVRAVHLTLLKPDGSGKAEVKPNKIMVGGPSGSPIVVAPPNDLLGLAITEGIEDALSVHQATELGAWAAGSAAYMPNLVRAIDHLATARDEDASPDCIIIMVDDDPAGRRNAFDLAAALAALSLRLATRAAPPTTAHFDILLREATP
jgi:Toprim domain